MNQLAQIHGCPEEGHLKLLRAIHQIYAYALFSIGFTKVGQDIIHCNTYHMHCVLYANNQINV